MRSDLYLLLNVDRAVPGAEHAQSCGKVVFQHAVSFCKVVVKVEGNFSFGVLDFFEPEV